MEGKDTSTRKSDPPPRGALGISKVFGQDITELRTLLAEDNLPVNETIYASETTKEIIRLSFEFIGTYPFLRDYVLSHMFDTILSKVWSWVRRKKPSALLQTGIELIVKNGAKSIQVLIQIPDQKSLAIKAKLANAMNEVSIIDRKDGDTISIKWETDAQKYSISVIERDF